MVDTVWIEYEEDLRQVLDTDAELEGVLSSIHDEGYEPNLYSEEIEGTRVWACPIRTGIFSTVQYNTETGQRGQEGSPSAEIAALEGLRQARKLDKPKRPRA